MIEKEIIATLLLGGVVGFMLGLVKGDDDGYKAGLAFKKDSIKHLMACSARYKRERDAYQSMAIALCDVNSDCMYCPYETEKDTDRCKLWRLVKEGQLDGMEKA